MHACDTVPVQREKKLHPNIRAPSATIGKGAALCTADISKTGESKSRNSGSSVSRAGASEEKKKLSIVEAQIAKLSVSSTSTFIPSSTTLPTPPPPPPAATAVTTTTAAAATATTTASTEKKRIKFCSECGNKFDIEKKVPKFCSECGTKVG